jgi:hypothetical protein
LGEYARYEPAYDVQFRGMVEECRRDALHALAVPASVDDDGALCLLGDMVSESPALYERFWDRPHEKRNKSERRLRNVLGLIVTCEDWAFFMIRFSRYTPAVIFLSDSPSDVEAVAAAAVDDGNPGQLIEKW